MNGHHRPFHGRTGPDADQGLLGTCGPLGPHIHKGFVELLVHIENVSVQAQRLKIIARFHEHLDGDVQGLPKRRRACVGPQRKRKSPGG